MSDWAMFERLTRDGSRLQYWPIRLRWGGVSHWFHTHGWSTGYDRVPATMTSFGCMPGWRAVFGWTLHLGKLKVCFGRDLPSRLPEIWHQPVENLTDSAASGSCDGRRL